MESQRFLVLWGSRSSLRALESVVVRVAVRVRLGVRVRVRVSVSVRKAELGLQTVSDAMNKTQPEAVAKKVEPASAARSVTAQREL